jgi:hypothetical protein
VAFTTSISNELRERIYACPCARCQALKILVEEAGATLKFWPHAAGRLCEIAVVAAAGPKGIPIHEVVTARRDYAKHLGLTLKGPISNSDDPVHIDHALDPTASKPIRLGTARAVLQNERYRIEHWRGYEHAT